MVITVYSHVFKAFCIPEQHQAFQDFDYQGSLLHLALSAVCPVMFQGKQVVVSQGLNVH